MFPLVIGDTLPSVSPVPVCLGLGAHEGRLGPGLGKGSGIYLLFYY